MTPYLPHSNKPSGGHIMQSAKGQNQWEAREKLLEMATEFKVESADWKFAPVYVAKCRYTGNWVINWIAKNYPKDIQADTVYDVPNGYDILDHIVRRNSYKTAREAIEAARSTMHMLLELQTPKK